MKIYWYIISLYSLGDEFFRFMAFLVLEFGIEVNHGVALGRNKKKMAVLELWIHFFPEKGELAIRDLAPGSDCNNPYSKNYIRVKKSSR